jgi:lipid II isoglutaminyl synthase (glutamine-hydrolysing)
MMLAVKMAIAKLTGGLARATGRGGGTSLPGRVLIRLDPHAMAKLSRRLARGSAVVSATNGKTTTAAMAASVLERTGARPVHNRAGANMAGGVASALLAAGAPRGRMAGDLGLFEVDEFWLGTVVEEVRPRAILLANLFRDQLDRYGELETIADRWAEVVASAAGGPRLVLNADDPLVADLGRLPGESGRRRAGVSYYGVDDDRLALPGLEHAADSKHCRRCGAAYRFAAVYLAHLGRYACPSCGASRPTPEVTAQRVELRGVRSATFDLRTPEGGARVDLPLPGLYNVYNALGAAALCRALDVPLPVIVAGLQTVGAAFGRAETIEVAGRPVSILLVKNPAGANEVLRTLLLEDDGLDVYAALNDGIADGRDVSWIWDVDFELLADRVQAVTCSGTRAAELALRLKYAGLDERLIAVRDDLSSGLEHALQRGRGTLYVLPTYTALLSLRELLAHRGQAPHYWA